MPRVTLCDSEAAKVISAPFPLRFRSLGAEAVQVAFSGYRESRYGSMAAV